MFWLVLHLFESLFKCVCRQCPVCPNVYSRLRMFSCLPIPPTRVPLPSECLFLHRSFQEDFRTLRSLFTLLRCHYNWRRSGCTALDVVGDLYVYSKQNLTQSLQFDLHCWGFVALSPSCFHGSIFIEGKFYLHIMRKYANAIREYLINFHLTNTFSPRLS